MKSGPSKSFLKLRPTVDHEAETDSEGSWAISYGDMITLLLCFFILFFSVDPKSGEKSKEQAKEEHEESLQTALLQVLSPSLAPPTSKPTATTSGGLTNEVSLGEKDENGADPELIKNWNGVAHKSVKKVLIEFPGVSFFDSGETHLTENSKLELKKFVQLYLPYAGSNILSIQAFTDERSVKILRFRKYQDNIELSALRAISCLRFLQKAGIPLSRMRVAGYGELKVTRDEIARLPAGKSKASGLELARKVALVIQPEGKTEP